jgi:5-formyltetrahydrofolate cyclo-ligase
MSSQLSEWSGRHVDKEALRQEIWTALKVHQATKRDPVGHIPNFVGADAAAARLAELDVWRRAAVVKCNPDAPQQPVRLQALREGKWLYMAVPRLARQQCFVALHREVLAAKRVPLAQAAHMREALIHGELVAFDQMSPIDVVVVGCVAVTTTGGRTGKGAGFADLELAMLREENLVQPDTPIVTTVHELQVVAADRLPMQAHDWPLDWIVTSQETLATHTPWGRPSGLDWETLQPDQIKKIPILRQLAQQRSELPQRGDRGDGVTA